MIQNYYRIFFFGDAVCHIFTPLLYEKVRKCLEEYQTQASSRQIGEDEIVFSGCFSVY